MLLHISLSTYVLSPDKQWRGWGRQRAGCSPRRGPYPRAGPGHRPARSASEARVLERAGGPVTQWVAQAVSQRWDKQWTWNAGVA